MDATHWASERVDLARLTGFVDDHPEGVTRRDVSVQLFQRRRTKAQLDVLTARMLSGGEYDQVVERPHNMGRPTTRYVRTAPLPTEGPLPVLLPRMTMFREAVPLPRGEGGYSWPTISSRASLVITGDPDQLERLAAQLVALGDVQL